ncbi:MAG TPA: hypothetical protein VNL95_03145 [Dehalococcoidia bacterium]|nr:hypothetical protein [Dehalococcoidia bacterium]
MLGKLLELDGRLALATAYRWRVLPEAVSLPDVAIRVLLRLGARDWVVRDDLRHRAWLVGLRQLIQAPLKGGERYARLADADPAPWRWWPFAQQVVDLLELAEALEEGRQLPLLEEVRP